MAVAVLFEVPLTPEELQVWAFAHQAHHRDIAQAIFNLTGASLPEYVLDPINTEDTGVWAYQHQIMHNNQNAVLGVSGYDLKNVNWKDRESLAGWIQFHAVEHYEAGDVLQIG